MHTVQTEIEVRYQETDQMGVVYHANYLVWLEIGRKKFIESLGLDYVEMEEQNIVSPVTNIQLSYKKPVRYGETVQVVTWLKEYNGIRTVYAYKVINAAGDIAVEGTTEHVIVHKKTFKPLSLRKTFPEWHEIYLKQLQGE